MLRTTSINFPVNSEKKYYERAIMPDSNYSFPKKWIRQRVTAVVPSFHDRNFGIEIEAYGLSKEAVATLLQDNGIDCFYEDYNHETTAHWKVVNDSSIHPPKGFSRKAFELVSPPLSGQKGIEQVIKVVKLLKSNGAKVNETCGIHIHVDCRAQMSILMAQIISLRYLTWEPMLDYFFNRSRRATNNFCKSGFKNIVSEEYTKSPYMALSDLTLRYPFIERPDAKRIDECGWLHLLASKFFIPTKSEGSLRELKTTLENSLFLSRGFISRFIEGCFNDRYRKINLQSYIKHGTIEFRQLEGTLDANKIAAWIHFCVSFVGESAMITCSYAEANGFGIDTPSRIEYFLNTIDDHPFSGMEEKKHIKKILYGIKRSNIKAYNTINEKMLKKNEADFSFDSRKKVFAKFDKVYPSIETLSNIGYQGGFIQSSRRGKIPVLYSKKPKVLSLDNECELELADLIDCFGATLNLSSLKSTVNSLSGITTPERESRPLFNPFSAINLFNQISFFN